MSISTSRIIHRCPVWRYLWPFQSRFALLTGAALFPAALALMAAVSPFADPAAPLIPVLLVLALAGMATAYAMLPREMQVHAGGGTGGAERIVRDHILASCYMITAMGNGVIRYSPVGSRWLRWQEHSVTVSPRSDSTLVIHGPLLNLFRIRKVLQGFPG